MPGTTNNPRATTALLLGSGECGRETTLALQKLGVHVHAADSYPGAPAHHAADYAHVIDLANAGEVQALVQDIAPDIVVPDVESLPLGSLRRVETQGLARVIPSTKAVTLTMNREKIRDLAYQQLGLPTSAYRCASTYKDMAAAAQTVGYPCVVKPVANGCVRGQSFVRDPAELHAAWTYAQSAAQQAAPDSHQRVIVEQFVPLDYEVTVLTVRSVDPETGRDATWFCEPIGYRQKYGMCVESWQPAAMSDVALDNARSVAARITGALGGRGVFGVELFIKGDDVYFSEVTPLPHDTGWVTVGTQRLSQFDLHARAILGLPVDTTLISPGASMAILTEEPGKAVCTGLGQALAIAEADIRLNTFPDIGRTQARPPASAASLPPRQLGVAWATAETVEEARIRASLAAAEVQAQGVVPAGA